MPASRPLALDLSGIERSFPVGLGFRRKPVLRGADLALEAGSTLGLVGPNGSGKSTLIRLCAGVDRASGGETRVLGGSPLEAAVRARLAYLPEESPFPAELTGIAVMELLGTLRGMPRRRARERGAELLERVGLGAHTRARVGGYSRGMKRRFGLAQAFLSDPELVLLDEPTAGLDAPGFAVLEDLLTEAHARAATVVIASHLISDVHSHCDRLALLLDGRVVAHDVPHALLAAEGRTEFVVEDLDERALDALEAWIAQNGGRIVTRRPGGRTLLELYRVHARGGTDD
ncbi:MAG: ABC transporter ATP-binding protein [bacterium]|nr:ABC transporter ATP-binding protein [bacterium]